MRRNLYVFIAMLWAAAACLSAKHALAGDEAAPGGTLIVLNKSDATASLISRRTGETIATVATGEGPHEVSVTPDGRTAVVGNYGQRTPGRTLTVIDLTRREAVRTIELVDADSGRAYHRPHGLAFLPDGKRLLVTAEQERKLLIVDLTAGRVLHAVDTEAAVSHMVDLASDGDRAFVANIGSGSVSVIDVGSARLERTIETGRGAEGIAVSPDGGEVWVTNRGADTITIIDAKTLEKRAEVACGEFPIRVKFTPDGRHALVSNARSGDVAVFDTENRKEVKRIPMNLTPVEKTDERLFGDRFGESPVPVGITIAPDGQVAWVASTNADIVTVIDLSSLEITGRLKAGREPDGLGYSSIE